jgi:hypothetical protein
MTSRGIIRVAGGAGIPGSTRIRHLLRETEIRINNMDNLSCAGIPATPVLAGAPRMTVPWRPTNRNRSQRVMPGRCSRERPGMRA